LIPVLEALSKVDDVRMFIRRFVYDNTIDYDRAMQVLEKVIKQPVAVN
jgi:hypothetical protein